MQENKIEEYDYLIMRIVTGDDQSAYYQLFNQFYAPLCVYAFRFVTDLQTREDLVQDVFLKLWQERKSIDIRTSVRAYLLIATRNRCLNFLRRKELERTYEQEVINGLREESSDEELYSLTELREMIDRSIAALPEKYRVVFEMSRYDGLTYREIADKQGIAVKTVELYMSKSLAILRGKLKDYIVFLIVFYRMDIFL